MITRKTVGDLPAPYEAIQFVDAFYYNTDSNVSDSYSFYGDGKLRNHIIYRYDKSGNFIRGDLYDATGKLIVEVNTAPEYYLYGKKRQK